MLPTSARIPSASSRALDPCSAAGEKSSGAAPEYVASPRWAATSLLLQPLGTLTRFAACTSAKAAREAMASSASRWPNLVLCQSKAVKHLFTRIRNAETDNVKFAQYSRRLLRVICEEGLASLPAAQVTITTPTGSQYEGEHIDEDNLAAVSILRAGDSMLDTLLQCVPSAVVGKRFCHSQNARTAASNTRENIDSDACVWVCRFSQAKSSSSVTRRRRSPSSSTANCPRASRAGRSCCSIRCWPLVAAPTARSRCVSSRVLFLARAYDECQ